MLKGCNGCGRTDGPVKWVCCALKRSGNVGNVGNEAAGWLTDKGAWAEGQPGGQA